MKAIQSMMGLINVTWDQGVIKPDGTLDEYKWAMHCWNHKECRVDGTREMMWLGEEKENHPAAPFLFNGKKFDLTKPNPQFFESLKRMVEIAHEYDLEFIYVLFDHCGVKKSERAAVNPWTNNIQGIKGFHKSTAEKYAKPYIESCVKCGVDKVYICNEPTYGYGPLLIRSREQLNDLGVKDRDIIVGAQHVGETELDKDPRKSSHPYWVWKQYRKTHGGDILKDDIMLSIHGFTRDSHIFSGVGVGDYASRRFWLSKDGVYPRPSTSENQKFLNDFRSGSSDAFLDDGDEWYIEAINNESHGGTGSEGLGFALSLGRKYKEYPKPEKEPVVIDPVPDPKPTPDPVEPEPVEEEIMFMKDWKDFKGFYEGIKDMKYFVRMVALLMGASFLLGFIVRWTRLIF